MIPYQNLLYKQFHGSCCDKKLYQKEATLQPQSQSVASKSNIRNHSIQRFPALYFKPFHILRNIQISVIIRFSLSRIQFLPVLQMVFLSVIQNQICHAQPFGKFTCFPLLEPRGIDHSESGRNNQSELIRNSQCTCLANRLPIVIQRDRRSLSNKFLSFVLDSSHPS